MGYQVQAVVAASDLLRRVASDDPDMHVVELAQGMALMPMTGVLHDRLTVLGHDDKLGFFMLPGGFAKTLAGWSADGAIAYVEADFFGGTGSQSAVVWQHGALAFGPLHRPAGEQHAGEPSPISQALRHLGVRRGRHADEFAAAGLDRHRDHGGWLGEIGVRLPEDDW
ncbi:hypothetical protein AB0M47_32490 [Hamadaea sp. NPDC051192]|uniref:hypothetical protein n=1 Tax=Hamadaea sp. NPDC051192 TaxID=3154940 RepID=UPI0034433523